MTVPFTGGLVGRLISIADGMEPLRSEFSKALKTEGFLRASDIWGEVQKFTELLGENSRGKSTNEKKTVIKPQLETMKGVMFSMAIYLSMANSHQLEIKNSIATFVYQSNPKNIPF